MIFCLYRLFLQGACEHYVDVFRALVDMYSWVSGLFLSFLAQVFAKKMEF